MLIILILPSVFLILNDGNKGGATTVFVLIIAGFSTLAGMANGSDRFFLTVTMLLISVIAVSASLEMGLEILKY